MAELSFSGVRKTYPGNVTAIQGIDMTVADGEFVVIVGPSGCGKSTLLRMVAGLERVSAGTISVDGRVVNELEPAQRDIAMVFQNYALYPHMTVYNNMAYGLKNQRRPKAEIERRVREAARILDLEDLLERRPRQLSGGQRQRVAMGRAIVREPKVFLFDEPLSNLDAKLRVQMRIEIKALQRRLGTTSLYVTHDQVEAMTLADRLVVMNQGVVEQIGAPLEVYHRPASVFVAGFIGSPAMNFLPGRLTADGAAVVVDDGAPIALSEPLPEQAGREVTVGIRPEHLAAADEGPAHARLRVDLVEPLGAETLIHGRLAGEEAGLTLRVHGAPPPAGTEMLPLSADPGYVHLFHADSGRRLEREPPSPSSRMRLAETA